MGWTCTFFGHRDCPAAIQPKLRAVVVELIERRGPIRGEGRPAGKGRPKFSIKKT